MSYLLWEQGAGGSNPSASTNSVNDLREYTLGHLLKREGLNSHSIIYITVLAKNRDDERALESARYAEWSAGVHLPSRQGSVGSKLGRSKPARGPGRRQHLSHLLRYTRGRAFGLFALRLQ